MAETKKYLDLNGLGYAIRKMDGKKANIESPDFTGTPTVNGETVATIEYVESEYVNQADKILKDEIEAIFGPASDQPLYAMKETVDALVAQINNLTTIIEGFQDYEERLAAVEQKTSVIEVK